MYYYIIVMICYTNIYLIIFKHGICILTQGNQQRQFIY